MKPSASIIPLSTRILTEPAADAPPPPRPDRCETCHHWDHERKQQPDKTKPAAAECHLYPPQMVVLNVPVPNNPRMVIRDPMANVPHHLEQQIRPVRSMTVAIQRCGHWAPLQGGSA